MDLIKEKKYSSTVFLIIIMMSFHAIVRVATGTYVIRQYSNTVYFQIGGNTIATYALYLASILAIVYGFLYCYRMEGRFPTYLLSILFCCMIATTWVVNDIFEHSLSEILREQGVSPFTFFLMFSTYIGTNNRAWKTVVYMSTLLSELFLSLAFIYSLKFAFIYGGLTISQSPQIMCLSNGFWPLVICCLCKEGHSKFEKKALYLQILVALICSLIYGSRGWIIQSLLLLFLFISKNSDDKKRKVKKLLTVFGAIIIIIAIFVFVSHYFPERTLYLVNKLSTGLSSREWQYNDLLTQYSLSDLLIGKGTFATYNTTVYGEYKYFDNTFINFMFRYGVINAISLFMFIAVPIIKLLKEKQKAYYYYAMALFLWLIGLCGVSVYNVMGIDLKSTLMFIVIGRALTMCYSKPMKSSTIVNS